MNIYYWNTYSKEGNTMQFLGREIEFDIAGIDMQDWPDFCDAYISEARYTDTGIELSDSELELLGDSLADQMNELVHEELVSR